MIELSAAADKLLEELKGKGIHLSLYGKRLRVNGNCSDELKKRILRHKEGLIQLVELGEHRWRKVEEQESQKFVAEPNLSIASNEPWVRDGWDFVIAHRGVIASHRSGFEVWWPFRTNPDLTPSGDTREDFKRRVVDKARKVRLQKKRF